MSQSVIGSAWSGEAASAAVSLPIAVPRGTRLSAPRFRDAVKGAQPCLAVVGASRHRPLPRQVRGRVVATSFEIRDLHLGPPRSAGTGVGIVLALARAE